MKEQEGINQRSSSRHSLPAWLRRPRGNEAVLGQVQHVQQRIGMLAGGALKAIHGSGIRGTSCCQPAIPFSPCQQWTCTGRGLRQLGGETGSQGWGTLQM